MGRRYSPQRQEDTAEEEEEEEEDGTRRGKADEEIRRELAGEPWGKSSRCKWRMYSLQAGGEKEAP